jgi:hypothetical protein
MPERAPLLPRPSPDTILVDDPLCPADLVNFFHFVAEEVRAGLAQLGYRSLDEVIGRSDLLKQREVGSGVCLG